MDASQEDSEVKYEDYSELIHQIAEENEVPVDLIRQILQLEPEYRNLHAWGARPSLRRALADLVNEALPEGSADV